jgi:hypothetical protein
MYPMSLSRLVLTVSVTALLCLPLPAFPAPAGNVQPDILAAQWARQAVADRQARGQVGTAIRRAYLLVPTKPDEAVDLLKRTRDDVRNNPDVSETARVALVERLESHLRRLYVLGAWIKREKAEAETRSQRRQQVLALLLSRLRTAVGFTD